MVLGDKEGGGKRMRERWECSKVCRGCVGEKGELMGTRLGTAFKSVMCNINHAAKHGEVLDQAMLWVV